MSLIKSLTALYYWDRLNKASKIFNAPLRVYSRKKSEQSPKMKAHYLDKLIKLKNLDYVEAFEFRNGKAREMNKKWKKYWEKISL